MLRSIIMRRNNCCSVPVRPPAKAARLADVAASTLAFLTIMAVLLTPGLCAGGEISEYKVKAGFVLNLVRFTDWPANELAKTREIKICTIGTDPFAAAFKSITGKLAKGKPIAISHLEQIEDLEGCNILFIGESERKHFSRILNYVKNAPILTISEVDKFTESGGMVNLLIERNKTVLEVNNASVHKADLKISSQVLKLAKKVIE